MKSRTVQPIRSGKRSGDHFITSFLRWYQKKKAKEQPFSRAKTPKKQGKKGKKTKQADDSLGFFARKAKKLAEKEANRQKSQKK